MKKIMIYDDIEEHGKVLKSILKNILKGKAVEIDVACNKSEALNYLENNSYYIIFLDIELEENESGIDVGRMIRDRYKDSMLVYISSYIKYCEEIFYNSPDAFLMKPFSEDGIRRTLDIIKKKQNKDAYISIGVGKNGVDSIDLSNIAYIETSSRWLLFFGYDLKPIYRFYNIKMTDIITKLPDYFVHCHQSIVLNMNYVKKIKRYSFVLKNDREIPISQGKFAQTRLLYLKYLGDKL